MSDSRNYLPSVEETLHQFEQLLETDTRVSSHAHPLGDVFAACQTAAKLLGLSGNLVRGSAGPDAGIEEVARSLGLCARSVTLSGEWWAHDHGVMLVREADTQKPLLLRSSQLSEPMVFTGPGQWGHYQGLTREVALSLETKGVTLYPLLPDTPLTFSSILGKVIWLYPFEVAAYLALTIIIALLSYSVPVASGMVIDHAVPHRNVTLLVAVVAVVITCNLIMLALRYTAELVVQRMEAAAGTHLQAGVLERLFRLPLSFFSTYNNADLMRRFTSLESARRTTLRMLVSSCMDMVTLLVGLSTLTFYYPLGALAVAGVTLLSLLVAFWLGKLSMAAYVEGETMTTNVLTVVYELVANMLPIRMFGADRRAFDRWRDNFVEMRRRTVRSARFGNFYSAFQQSSGLLTLGLVFAIVAYSVKPNESATVGNYVAFVGSLSLVTGAVNSLASTLMSVFGLLPSANMAAPILKAMPESVTARKRVQGLTGDVEVAGLSFRYTDESPWVLSDLSLTIKPGEFVGIVGSSGCGKSTLVKLLLGLLPPIKGSIYFDKNDLAAIDLDSLRQQCGVMLQDYRMFSGSILENIAAGRDLEMEEVLAVLDTIGMGDFVKALPMGIHTVVGESTTAFSGGQVQLMALARALAGDPKLLIFDEATSALDHTSLKTVGEVIGKLPMSRIMFTHRLGTLKECDRIIVLEQGTVSQEGSFDELMLHSEFFQALTNPEVG